MALVPMISHQAGGSPEYFQSEILAEGARLYPRLAGLGEVCYVDINGNDVCTPDGVSKPGVWDTILAQISSWSKTGQDILKAENLPRGVLTQTAPGQFTYVQPSGTQPSLPVSTTGFQATASSGFGMVVIGGAALLVLFMMMRKK